MLLVCYNWVWGLRFESTKFRGLGLGLGKGARRRVSWQMDPVRVHDGRVKRILHTKP